MLAGHLWSKTRFQPLPARAGGEGNREVVIKMWWVDIVVVVLIAFGIYGFATLVGFHTRRLTGKTDRRAEDMYDQYGYHQRSRRRQS
jgi:hypothetical protein